MRSVPPSPSRARRSRLGFLVGLLVWTTAVAFGFQVLVNYELTPGSNHPRLARLPEGNRLALDHSQPNLVMLVHPQCPCSRASVGELEKIMTECRGHISATVLFFAPATESIDWTHSDLWRRASAIPGVSVQADPNGRTAAQMGVTTSGHVLLFDTTQTLLFSGGITGARGHEGANAGRSAVVALALGRTTKIRSTPVFGCAIDPTENGLASDR